MCRKIGASTAHTGGHIQLGMGGVFSAAFFAITCNGLPTGCPYPTHLCQNRAHEHHPPNPCCALSPRTSDRGMSELRGQGTVGRLGYANDNGLGGLRRMPTLRWQRKDCSITRVRATSASTSRALSGRRRSGRGCGSTVHATTAHHSSPVAPTMLKPVNISPSTVPPRPTAGVANRQPSA